MNTTYLLLSLLGVVFHSLLKMDSLQKDFRTANLPFDPVKDYLLKDKFALLASVCSVAVWYLLFDEVAKAYPALDGFKKVSFFVMGAMGSYVLQMLLSKAKGEIRSVVDYKTNVADGVVPPITKENAEGVSDAIKEDKL